MLYQCTICGYVYDEDEGEPESRIPPKTKWGELPKDWTCPVCGAEKNKFELLG